MGKAEANVEELVSKIERGEIRLGRTVDSHSTPPTGRKVPHIVMRFLSLVKSDNYYSGSPEE